MHTIADTRVTRFALGACYLTQGARSALLTHNVNFLALIARHAQADWGDLDDHDRQVNAHALVYGGRLMSVYTVAGGVRLYVITEADRSVTTMLLPSEY